MDKPVNYYELALSLKARGIPFELAYEIIFGRPVRPEHDSRRTD